MTTKKDGRVLRLQEDNAHPLLLSPYDVARMPIVAVADQQLEIIRDAEQTGDLKTGARGRQVSNCTVDAAAVFE
jgi:hypothetical protein